MFAAAASVPAPHTHISLMVILKESSSRKFVEQGGRASRDEAGRRDNSKPPRYIYFPP